MHALKTVDGYSQRLSEPALASGSFRYKESLLYMTFVHVIWSSSLHNPNMPSVTVERHATRTPTLLFALRSLKWILNAHAPSLPNSFVQSSLRLISSCETVGRAPLTALTKSFSWRGGSRSLSESTSVQVISIAPASPGEQGVSFSMSPSITWCSLVNMVQRRKIAGGIPSYNA